MPSFLGAEGSERRYFVGMQSSAHLRGTGGLIGFWGILSIEDGQLSFGQSDVHDIFDEVGQAGDEPATGRISALGGSLEVGVDTDADFLERYGWLAGHSSFSQVNLDPDLPTVARVALELFELRTGERLDGLILLDDRGVERLLVETGPTLPLSEELATMLGLSRDLPTDRFAELVTVDIYETLGSGRTAERKDALRRLGDAAFLQVLAGGWDTGRMLQAVAEASAGRHLQVYSRDDVEQTAFAVVGATGALMPESGSDLVAVIGNNTGGGKQDVHLGHEFDLDIELADPRRTGDGSVTVERHLTIGVTVDNPLPSEGMDEYVIGNCVLEDATNRCFEGPPGWNWTWFSTWLGEGTEIVSMRTDDGSGLAGLGDYRGLMVADRYQGSAPAGRGSFEIDAMSYE
jgi:hypothetical protein